jgi:hypothetical protein
MPDNPDFIATLSSPVSMSTRVSSTSFDPTRSMPSVLGAPVHQFAHVDLGLRYDSDVVVDGLHVFNNANDPAKASGRRWPYL